MFEPDDTCLKLLLEHGLSARDRNNWLVREDGKFAENSETVFDYQLAWALEHRMSERVHLLVDHGADVLKVVNGRTPFQWARLGGDRELAEYLVRKGAVAVHLAPEDEFYIKVMSKEVSLEELLAMKPSSDILAAMQKAHPAMLHDAAGESDLEAVRRMLALGLDVNAMTSRTPLHEAALHGHIEMAKLLIEHGADATIRDPHFHSGPIGWAEYNGKQDMVEFLKAYPSDIFATAAFGLLDQLADVIRQHPEQVNIRFGEFRTDGQPTDRDWMTPLGFAIVNRRTEAVRFLLEHGAERSVRDVSGRSYRDLAKDTGDETIVSLLRQPTTA